MKSRYLNILLMLFSLAISLFVIEAGFRISRGRLINSGSYLFAGPGDESWKWWKMLRESSDKNLSYEHIPGSQAYVFNTPVKINSFGFRDNEYPVEKAQDTYRIIGVGDSIMFGWRVDPEDTYMKILERDLSKKEKTEVINCSVPGYNTLQEYYLVKDLVPKFSPDMVIMGFFINDVYDPAYVLWKGKYLVSPKTVEHYEKNRNILKHFHRFLINHLKIYDYMVSRIKKKSGEKESLNIVLNEGDWQRVRQAIIDTAGYLKQRNIRFIVFYVPSQQELIGYNITNPPIKVLKELCSANGIEFCTAFYAMSNEADKQSLYIKDDGHLTKKGHLVAASVLEEYLDKTRKQRESL